MPPPNQPVPPVATVLFDADCPLCVALAGHAQRRVGGELTFASWQDFSHITPPAAQLPADRLRVLLADQTLLAGEEAWAYLLANYRDLSGLNWLAAKAGLGPQLARVASTAGLLARHLCRRCPRPKRR